jgi:hypothetical protein
MKYFILFLIALSFPLKASSQLSMPIGGEQNKDWWIYSYRDDDTTTGSVRNFKCSNYCYDGWSGMIFAIKNMKLMDKGIPILAAANGIVHSFHNGDTDRVKQSIGGGTHGNYVRIQHDPHLYTLYAFLRNGSIRVHKGDVVKKGDTLAMAGSSDNICFWPGLYFRVEDTVNANFQDPMGDQCASPPYGALLSTVPIYDTTFGLIDAGVTNTSAFTVDTIIERPPTATEISVTDDPFVCIWTQTKNEYTGDVNEHIWIKPDGSIFRHDQWTETSDNHLGFPRSWEPTYKLDTGIWLVKCIHNGDTITTQTFHVVQQHSGVAQSNPILQSTTFPQPAKDHITLSGISAKEAYLFDSDGNEHPIRFDNISDGVTIFWRDLPKGAYFINIKDAGGRSHRAKIMVSP